MTAIYLLSTSLTHERACQTHVNTHVCENTQHVHAGYVASACLLPTYLLYIDLPDTQAQVQRAR